MSKKAMIGAVAGLGMMIMGAASPSYATGRQMIQFGTDVRATSATDGHAEGSSLVGGVWISHRGQIRVIWEGVSLNGGQVRVSTEGERQAISATFPTLTLDLQQLLGRQWMRSIELKVAGGSYDNDLARGTTDLFLGRLSVALTQTVVQNSAWTWTLTEGVGTAARFRREFHETGRVFEAVPVNFSLDTRIVRRVSNDVAVTLAMGAYGMVMQSLAGGDPILARGGYIAPEVSIGSRFTAGVRLEASEMMTAGSDAAGKQTLNATAFVRYLLSTGGSNEHAVTLQLGSFYDEALTRGNGDAREGVQGNLMYTVSF